MTVIYRQEIIQDISFFINSPKANFYDKPFLNMDLSNFSEIIADIG